MTATEQSQPAAASVLATGRPRILTLWLDHYYGEIGRGPSNEQGLFGGGLFASMGWDERHIDLGAHDAAWQVSEAMHDWTPDAAFFVPYVNSEAWLKPMLPVNTPVIAWFCDATWRSGFLREMLASGAADYAVSTDAAVAGPRIINSNWGCRPDLWPIRPPILVPQLGATFAGFMYGEREVRVRAIGEAGPVSVFVHDCRAENPVWSIGQYHRFLASYTFALALTQSSTGLRQMKARLFEPQVHGTVLVTEPVPGLEDYWTPDVECLTFVTPSEAQAKMQALHSNPAAWLTMSRAGFERALREHSFQARFAAIFREIGLPVPVEPDWSAAIESKVH